VASFVRTTCPSCGGPAERETDVSDTFVDSAWYFLRYPSSDVADRAWDPERTERLLPVDQYAGGREHIARHHLYARFVTAALHDLGLVSFAEPFERLRLHGLLNKDGAKMSKSRGNVVDPDAYVDTVGADVLRTYLLFCGDWESGGDFSDRGLQGIVRFLRRAWAVVGTPHDPGPGGVDVGPARRCAAAVARDIERLKFNTAISTLMETLRWLRSEASAMSEDEWSEAAGTFVLCLAPFAPYVADELWERLGRAYSVHGRSWPETAGAEAPPDSVTVVVQVDGRVRDRIDVRPGAGQDEVTAIALEREAVRRHLGGVVPRRVVFVPNRLVNLVP
jgi:leucyl-tRNA synthetase